MLCSSFKHCHSCSVHCCACTTGTHTNEIANFPAIHLAIHFSVSDVMAVSDVMCWNLIVPQLIYAFGQL